MDYKQELLGTAFKRARSTKQKILELGITPDLSEELTEALVNKLAAAKVKLLDDGTKVSQVIGGMEWYVTSLITKSAMADKDLLSLEYDELNIDNSTFDELVGML